MKRILVIDGNSIINRAFYGVRPLTTKSGKNTNAIFGMINIISKQTERIKPDYALVIESKAVQDIYGVPDEDKVCILGDGAIISFMDNATRYDKDMVEHLISICKEKDIKYQPNKYQWKQHYQQRSLDIVTANVVVYCLYFCHVLSLGSFGVIAKNSAQVMKNIINCFSF